MAKTSRPPFGGGNVASCHFSAALAVPPGQEDEKAINRATTVGLKFFIDCLLS